MNFLILAAGTRNKIVQYFKRTFDGIGNIVATDKNLHYHGLIKIEEN